MNSRGIGAALLAAPIVLSSACNPHVTEIGEFDAGLGRYIEAEDGQLSGGFLIGADSTASGGHFIYSNAGATFDSAPGGDAHAQYELTAVTTGTYLIWGRIHGQDIDRNRFWFQVDGGTWTEWRITTGDVWFWDYFHDNVDYGTATTFDLTAGPHTLVIANAADNTGLDRLYYAPDRNKPEGSDTLCNPPHTVQFDGVCNPSCGELSGHCGGTPCTGLPTFATYDCPACCTPPQ